ncbi:Receptor-like kinase TMK3 [Linum perenne]
MADLSHLRTGLFLILCLLKCVHSATDPNDFKVLMDFKKGLKNPELLRWPDDGGGGDPCGPPLWPHVYCSGERVTQIQVKNMGLAGSLPENFNRLTKLYNLGLQRNNFTGKLPTFSGLSELEYAFLDYNNFDTIPSDFFDGLDRIRVLALDDNPLNKTKGWNFPAALASYGQLINLSMVHCNLVGPLPEFPGALRNVESLKLSYNNLTGKLPSNFRKISSMSILWLNNQQGRGGKLNGTLDVLSEMTSLTQVWLQGNSFTGTIPDGIGDLVLLKKLNLNMNSLSGVVPKGLADLELDELDLNNNKLMGPIPKFKAKNASYDFNSFCQDKPGVPCDEQVNLMLDFMSDLNYPLSLASDWTGNDPCQWPGLSCDSNLRISVINLPRKDLTGNLSPSLAKLSSLVHVNLGENSLNGSIPENYTDLQLLRVLDVSGNDLSPPLPRFQDSVKLVINGNTLLVKNQSVAPANSPLPPRSQAAPPQNQSPIRISPSQPRGVPPPSAEETVHVTERLKSNKLVMISGIVAGIALSMLVIGLCLYLFCMPRTKRDSGSSNMFVDHPRDPYDPESNLKRGNYTGRLSSLTATSTSLSSGSTDDSGGMVLSVQVLKKVTDDFASGNELGRGGFGTVYKGRLEDGTMIAVKRMEAGVFNSKGLGEFEAEIAVLSRARHRHLVSLLGYAIGETERLLVYEYMSQGALSRHLFQWQKLNLDPLSWTRRLSIALDVARGMEYLHSMARETFIHRDLKPSNILLGEDFRAKVSDFGLVKLAQNGHDSVATRLAGTFGYLAPEYAGKITTKSDVFSYGVVLMELLTGLTALNDNRAEESRYLPDWFRHIKSDREKITNAIDPELEKTEETVESIAIVVELAGHCTAREPSKRPDMSHVVNVLAPLVEKWKPSDDNVSQNFSGMDLHVPLMQVLKVWKEQGNTSTSSDAETMTTTSVSCGADSKNNSACATWCPESFDSGNCR